MQPVLQGQHAELHLAPATASLPGNSEVECACCLLHTQQAELATFQGVSGLESRPFSSPSPTAPQRALIKVKREMKESQGSTVVWEGWERDMVSLSVSN